MAERISKRVFRKGSNDRRGVIVALAETPIGHILPFKLSTLKLIHAKVLMDIYDFLRSEKGKKIVLKG